MVEKLQLMERVATHLLEGNSWGTDDHLVQFALASGGPTTRTVWGGGC